MLSKLLIIYNLIDYIIDNTNSYNDLSIDEKNIISEELYTLIKC